MNGTVKAYASGSGALSFVRRDENQDVIGPRPTLEECIEVMRNKVRMARELGIEGDWLIVNVGPLDRAHHEKYEAVQRVTRVADDTLKFDDQTFTYDPADSSIAGMSKYAFHGPTGSVAVENPNVVPVLRYFRQNEELLADPARILWESSSDQAVQVGPGAEAPSAKPTRRSPSSSRGLGM